MRSLFDDFAFIYHDDAVCTPHHGKPMRYNYGRSTLKKPFDRFLHPLFRLAVKCAGRFIEY